jgi:hypothetical protein
MTADREFAQTTAERRLEGFSSFLEEDVTTIRQIPWSSTARRK